MGEGNRAAELVKSYPPTAENYGKVINSLKNRFGREDLLIEVYVRELLQLVLQNTLKSKSMSLASLYDKIESYLRSLDTLGVTSDKCAAMLFPLVESALLEEILRAWQRSQTNSTTTRDGEVQNEERISMEVKGFDLATDSTDGDKKRRAKMRAKNEDTPTAMGLLTTKEKDSTCVFCSSCHDSTRCEKAKKLSLDDRREHAKKKNVCFNCLRAGHNFRQCRIKLNCSWCSMRHLLIMCSNIDKKRVDKKADSVTKDSVKKDFISKEPEEGDCNLANLSSDPEVLMQTLCVKLRNKDKEIQVRAIIDTGSQKLYVTKEMAENLGYEPVAEQTITHSLFGGQQSKAVRHKKYKIHLSSMDDNYRCNFAALDQDVICGNLPLIQIGEWGRELKELGIDASDRHSKREAISVLIGVDVAEKLYTGRIHVLKNGLVAMETYLGWLITGKVPEEKRKYNVVTTAMSLFVNNETVSDLWSLDVLGIRDPIETKTKLEQEADMHETFLKTVRVNKKRRYEIKLPWLQNHPELPQNKKMALSRLQSTIQKLKADNVYMEYDAVFLEWLAEGIIERVPEEEKQNWGHYLPHRHVLKEGSTTRIRPVFDASAKEHASPSLNDCLHKGPNLIELLRFFYVLGKIVSELFQILKRLFLQISIDKTDRDFLRFLWYNVNGKIIIYRHCRVVFGVSSSPFILSAIINLHLNNCLKSLEDFGDDKLRENIKRLLESFYVDNSITSINSRENLNSFISDAKEIMDRAGFDLRGWEYSHDNSLNNQTTVLGILWDKKSDTLALNVSDFSVLSDSEITKRNILSFAHRVFDPLGVVCPVMLCPRILLQDTWNLDLTWDNVVPDDIKIKFFKWIKDLKNLKEINIPRCFLGEISESDNISLHIFCDASKTAYASVIFIRVENCYGVNVYFVQAKTRVAPAKKSTTNTKASIPRLELLAATIGVRLASNVLNILKVKNMRLFYWTDSSTVLAWIKRKCNWATFVYNRVKEICTLSDPIHWHHIQGLSNPADLPSRGCTVSQLISSRWWEGPRWLYKKIENWPTHDEWSCDENEINLELKKTASKKDSICTLVTIETNTKKENEIFNRFSSFDKMIRVFVYILRFYYNCRIEVRNRIKGNPSYKEIQMSRILLLKLVQREVFTDEKDMRIKHLNAFMGRDNLIRLKTKIVMRNDVYNFRYPIILPGKHRIVSLIIKEKHENLKHAGVEILMNVLREEYWIIGGRKVIRSVITKCIICRRHDAKPCQTVNAPLPVDRIKGAAVFEVIGVDFTGPIYLKGGKKAWICLFTCAVFRALHFELVTSLSTAALLMAIRRFIARRGRPSVIYSDNGTNFVGLNNMLKDLNFEKLARTLAMEQIQWKFNPPAAAWWGGFWERLNRVLKQLLRRTLKKSCLDYEEMSTVLLDCETVINARPITFLSNSEQNISPITPSMFLQEIKDIGVLDLDKIEKSDLPKRQLIHRKSHIKIVNNVEIGDLVLIENENAKRINWVTARVKELIPGKDGNVRVVRLTTAKGELVRPIQKIYPLELKYDKSESVMNEIVTDKYKGVRKSNECVENIDDVTDKVALLALGIASEPNHIPPNHALWTGDLLGSVAITWRWWPGAPPCASLERGERFAAVRWGPVAVIGVYLPPPGSPEEYGKWLENIGACIDRLRPLPVLVAGDFNAWSTAWGSRQTNVRGRLLGDWAACRDLALLNQGSVSTCVRPRGESIVDLTWATPAAANMVSSWRVAAELEHLSDHRYISVELRPRATRNGTDRPIVEKRWAIRSIREDVFKASLEVSGWNRDGRPPARLPVQGEVDQLMEEVTAACDASMRRVRRSPRRSAYWWSEEIAELRREATRRRRVVARSRDDPTRTRALEAYKEARKELRSTIVKAKAEAWGELIQKLDEDPWGLAYKIVTKKLRPVPPR
ncbi:uncharacterized protein [Cardiocondyla obscurior]|uniref:uncharacterized protein n=1 Tax=Cardiocondyla obscurior TaxID=286306 RepID=UPI00396565D3